MPETPQRRTVLIVDDDEDQRVSLEETLDSAKWEPKCFSSWKQASVQVTGGKIRPDVAIIDLHLPGDSPLNGVDVIKELSSKLPALPVMALTGHDQFSDAAKSCIDAGAVQFVKKGVELAEIEDRLEQAIWIKNVQVEARKVEAARQAQELFLPQGPPELDGLLIGQEFRPAEKVGGDYYDYFCFPQSQQLVVAIGDARGHTLRAAMHASAVGGGLRALVETAGTVLSPGASLEVLNRVVERGGSAEAGVSLFVGIIDVRARRLRYAVAGLPRQIVLRHGRADFIGQDSFELGTAEYPNYVTTAESLDKGDVLLLYTDGATDFPYADEGRRPSKETLAEEAQEIRKRHKTSDLPSRLADRVLELAGCEQYDDCTIIAVEFVGS
jgi:serine phosphatase RsbU (regulator of sigma subunit)